MLSFLRNRQRVQAADASAIGGVGNRGISSLNLPLIDPAEEPRSFERLLFVCGLHRSGTTLIERTLHCACEISVLRANVPESEGQHLQDVYPSAARHGGPGRFAFSPEMHPTPPDTAEAERARDRILACWTKFVEGEAPVLLEKSPPNLTKIPWLRAVFPGAQFVIVTRDPRAVAAATQKMSGASIPEMVFHWHVAHDRLRSRMGPDCHLVRYEDFCANMTEAIEGVIEGLGLKRRPSPLPLPERFANITSTNDRYIDGLPRLNYGSGSWRDFGYDLRA